MTPSQLTLQELEALPQPSSCRLIEEYLLRDLWML